MRLSFLCAPALLLGALFGCAPADDAESPLLVLAAASLNNAMPALIEGYQAEHPGEIELVLGSTGNLAAQIENGAPADLFFAADVETVERLAGQGSIDPASVAVYGRGQLAMLARGGAALPENIGELSDPAFQVIAIANPEHAPYGAAARQALQSAGIWDAVEGRIVFGENVAQAYQLARTGNADVSIVARSVLVEGDVWGPVDADLYTPIDQAAGLVREGNAVRARAFLDFVLSPEGQAILAASGFGTAS